MSDDVFFFFAILTLLTAAPFLFILKDRLFPDDEPMCECPPRVCCVGKEEDCE